MIAFCSLFIQLDVNSPGLRYGNCRSTEQELRIDVGSGKVEPYKMHERSSVISLDKHVIGIVRPS